MKKLHTLGKQCLALLITATMCFSMMQVTAFAEDVSTEPHNEGIELYSGEDGDDVENPKTTSETKDGITTTTTIT